MVKELVIDNKCTGCNQCVSVCPQNAIELKRTREGFWYPEILKNCVHCGKCSRMCPVYGGKPIGFLEPKTFVGWNLNEKIRYESSSGGIFSMLAEKVLEMGGCVYGAAYTSDWQVAHIRITNKAELYRLRGSKYVQSYISPEIYAFMQKDAECGLNILFSGTPCQAAAVHKFLGRYDKFWTVDVICHGVPSCAAWNRYLQELQCKGTITDINMRSKKYGWNHYHMVIEFENGTTDDVWFNDNLWGKSFVRSLFLRPSCYQCEFKEHIRCADISLGDFWEAARGTHTEFDDGDKGTSVILVNSEKGKQLLEGLNCCVQPIPYEWIPERTYAVVRSSENPTCRAAAFRMLDSNLRFTRIVEKCTMDSFLKRIIRIVGKIVRRK